MPVVNNSLTWSADVGYTPVSDIYYAGFAHTDALVGDIECIQNHVMGDMTLTDFNEFFGTDSNDRSDILRSMIGKFDSEFTTALLEDYNSQKGLLGKYQIDTITMTKTNDQISSDFDAALNSVNVPSTMFDSTAGSHLQIVFKFLGDGITSKVSFTWDLV